MTKEALNICISKEYAETLGDLNNIGYLVKSGAAIIRNKFIFNSILTRLNKKNISYKFVKLNVTINHYKLLSIHLLPFLIFKNSNSFQACSLSSLAKLSKAFKLSSISDCNFVFLYHAFSLLKYYHTINNIKVYGRPIVVLEMPENIVETTSYLAHKRYCIKNLEKNLQTYARPIDIITSPTFRDSIYYSRVLNIRNVFTIYNVYNVFPEFFTDKYILNRKTHGSLCISMGAWCNEYVTKFVNNILSLLNLNNKTNITEIHILGCRKLSRFNIGNVNIYYHGTLPLKDYLDVLSTCLVTILYPRLPWSGGHSVRLNDAALMGNVILGSDHDLRGEPYKYQYTYIDERDLVTKLQWLIDSTDLISLGMENRRIALERAEKNEKALDRLVDVLLMSISNTDK
jgi:hypothetical protein